VKQVKRAISVLTPDNFQVAEMLEQIAKLLEIKQADPFRVAAYRRAARSVAQAVRPLWQVLAGEGLVGIRAVEGVGPTTGAAVAEYLQTGRVAMLERLKAELPPEELFRVVPGIGSELAHRIADELRIKTLEDLELAAHDGRLSAVSGFGERRTKLVRDALAGILSRRNPPPVAKPQPPRLQLPSVDLILHVDAEYRHGAKTGSLRKIAPRRFNPEGKAWLPLLHTQQGGWTFTALFSNTAVAHQLGATGDWVVIFYERGTETGQCTVVTERRGLMIGKRVVRGREAECRAFYFLRPPSSSEHSAPEGAPFAAAS
jgi:hypothetical protein